MLASCRHWPSGSTKYGDYIMRNLETAELGFVSGAGHSPCPPSKPKKDKKPKGNNGFGNGGGDPAPGNSGSTGQDKDDDVVR
jgi:hypothetical protein